MRRARLIPCVALILLVASSEAARGQTKIFWNGPPPGPQNWNLEDNWDPAFIPSLPLGGLEFAVFENGGRAFIDANLPAGTDVVAGLIIGETAAGSGFLEIRNGGALGVQEFNDDGGFAIIGDAGRGVLDVLPGGVLDTLTLSLGGHADSQINVGDGGAVFVEGPAVLNRHVRMTGPGAILNADSFVLRGTLTADITGPAHGPLTANQSAQLRGGLRVEFNGHNPQFGESWDLVDAGSLIGEFSSVDTSAAPALPDGLQYRVLYDPAAGDATLSVGNSLVLTVNVASGLTTMSNVVGGPITFDGYNIHSPDGLLTGLWHSFADSGTAGAGWEAANPTMNDLSELNLPSATTLPVGESLSIGTPYLAPIPPAIGDLVFQYTSGGNVLDGIVQFIDLPGDTNNDGAVDIVDLNNVRNNFGGGGAGVDGDTNGDGVVDIVDLNSVRNNFGNTAAVPEPTGGLLLLFGLALCGGLRCRR